MSTLSFDIATILQDNGYGVIGSSIYLSDDVPPKPDHMVKIRLLGTSMPDSPNINLQTPLVRVTVRDGRGRYQECEAFTKGINNFLSSVADYSVNDSRFVYINNDFGPIELGIDPLMRPSFSVDFKCKRTSA
jgi:hypothetical protein